MVINNSVHFTKRKNYVVLKLFEDPKLVSTIDSFIPFSISEFNHLLIIDFNFRQTNLLCRIFTNPKNPVRPIVRHFYIDLLNIKCSIYRLCLDWLSLSVAVLMASDCGGACSAGVIALRHLIQISVGRVQTITNHSTQARSLECGMATGCVKILKRAFDFDHLGKFIPEHKREPDVDLFRGQTDQTAALQAL